MKSKDAPWKKSYDKSRLHIITQNHPLLTKVCIVKAMVFPVVIYGCESWTIKKAECQRIDAFKLWCWWRLSWESLAWTTRRLNQSVLNETLNVHWKDQWWSWSYNTLATWWEELTHWKGPWCWERLRAEGERITEDEMVGWHHQLDGHEFEQAPGVGDGQGSLVCCTLWSGKDTTEWLNWTEILCTLQIHIEVSVSGYRWRNWDSER